MFVEEGEGELLQMAEQLAPHISLDSDADDMAPILNDIVEKSLQYIDEQQHQRPGDEQTYILIGHIVVDDVLGDDRVEQVTAGYDKGADHIQNKQLQMRPIVFCKLSNHVIPPSSAKVRSLQCNIVHCIL